MKAKRSYRGVEFMLMYGWVVLMLLLVISALTYFGVFSPHKFLPERCVTSSGIACLYWNQSTSDIVEVTFQNDIGETVYNITMDTTQIQCGHVNKVLNGDKFIISCEHNFTVDKKARVDFEIGFWTMEHEVVKTGEILFKVR